MSDPQDEAADQIEPLEPDAAEISDSGGSLRDRLRAKREELSKETTLVLVVPGYGNDLAVRYHAIEGQEAEKMAKKIGKRGAGLVYAAQVLAKCCECILVREDEDADLEPLINDATGQPVAFDNDLADYLTIEANTTSELVISTFSPARNRDFAVTDAATALISWMQGREAEIDEALLGN